MSILRVAVLLAAQLALPIAAAAQQRDTVVSVGDRVRIYTTIIEYPVEGEIIALDEAAVIVGGDGLSYFRAPRTEILGTEVSVGKGPRHVVQGTLIGAAAFAGIGLFVDVDPNDCGASSDNFCSRGEAVLSVAVGGGVIGALLGLFRDELWAPATLGVSSSAFLPGRLDLGVALAFSP